MSIQRIFNENCFDTINKMIEFEQKIDLILTSPPPIIQVDQVIQKNQEIIMKEDMIFI